MLVTVDDDPSVSRAVARDLRRRYGRDHQVVRAASGAEALDALREIKLRGGRVAVMLADYRMPEMSWIEFLEAAMDLFPRARRALLTAYADTDAAIAAINLVDVDYYLLKPWEPPEEKLYPIVDAMLEAYTGQPDVEMAETKLIGHRWSVPSFAARDLLARNAVPYRWIAADEPEGGRLLQAAGLSAQTLPVVITADGGTLLAPSTTELATAVGLSTTPATEASNWSARRLRSSAFSVSARSVIAWRSASIFSIASALSLKTWTARAIAPISSDWPRPTNRCCGSAGSASRFKCTAAR